MAIEEHSRPFQRRVLALLMQGKNVILQAPTGAGKTRAALQPFIQNLARKEHLLPQTCLYATPMRVLSNQFYQYYHGRISRLDQHQGTDFIRLYQKLGQEPVSIQTGEQPEDPQFESLLTFCTIDQLLASFLGVPYMDSRKANLNVGAVLGSYLVLDEFHLYPLSQEGESCFGARTTALSMLRLLQPTARFLLMTATFSTHLLTELKELLNAEVVSLSDDELAQIAEGRERTFALAPVAMSAEAVLEKHDRCSLVICNTVLRAQQMYWQIRQRVCEQKQDVEVILLHSRLIREDRAKRSELVMHELGQAPGMWEGDERFGWKDGQYYGKNLIVVATQVVEVGLDISVQVLHTELAPASSLIQRAGRCARFARQKGQVIVYPLLDEQGEVISTKPYHPDLCKRTWIALENLVSEQVVGFRQEQALIDAVHTEEDRALLERYERNRDAIEKDIFTSLNEHTRGVASRLIRDVEQVHILIHDDPDEAIQEEPWCWQSFALHPDSLAASWRALQDKAAELDLKWMCKQAIAVSEGDADVDSRQKVRYQWQDIATSNTSAIARTLRGALMVVLPPQLATYHDELGFVLLDGRMGNIQSTGYQSTLLKKKNSEKPDIFIRQQSYLEHISGLVLAYNQGIRQSIQYAAERLEDQLKVPRSSVDQAIRLTLACHDIGKLSEGWQHWAWEWQSLLFQKGWSAQPPRLGFFAKTDYDSRSNHRKWQRDLNISRPPHACESVAAGVELIAESLYQQVGEEQYATFLRAVCGAIAHHHTADAQTFRTFRLKQGAQEVVQTALERAREQGTWIYSISELQCTEIKAGDLAPSTATATDPDTCITRPRLGHAGELETWLYFLIVRALRLADQRADLFQYL